MVFPRFCGRFIVTIPSNKTGGFAKTPVRLWYQQRFCGLAPARGLLLATRKRVRVFFQSVGPEVRFLWADSEYTPLSFSCSFLLCLCSNPGTRNSGSHILYFRFPCLSWIWILLFPLSNPINPSTLSFGGISTSIWICFGHTSASTMWIPFQSHNSRRIFPFSALCSLYNIFSRYFVWYSRFHVVWPRLLLSFAFQISSFSYSSAVVCLAALLSYQEEFLFPTRSQGFSWTPGSAWGGL